MKLDYPDITPQQGRTTKSTTDRCPKPESSGYWRPKALLAYDMGFITHDELVRRLEEQRSGVVSTETPESLNKNEKLGG